MREEPLRVALVSRAVYPVHGYGGLERHVFDLVKHLTRREVHVTLITKPLNRPAGDLDRVLQGSHARVVEIPYVTFPGAGRRGTTILDRDTAYPLFGYRAGRAALSLCERGQVDLVHGLGASVLGYARAKSRLLNNAPPLVFNPQGLEEFGATDSARAGLKTLAYWPLQLAVRACARAADCVIATDQSLAPIVERHLSVDSQRVRVVPNAVDIEMCDDLAGPESGLAIRQRFGFERSTLVFLSVGRLEANKGLEVMVEALASLSSSSSSRAASLRSRKRARGYGWQALPDWRWVVIGDGPFRPRLEAAIGAKGIGSKTQVVGRVNDRDLHAWYEAADVFVHPTLYEGSSLVTLEAMTHRRAVIASAAGGLPDKVQPGVTGWLVPPGDAAALGDAISQAATHPARDELGAAGRALVERTFSWHVVADHMMTLYRELVERHSRAQGPFSPVRKATQ